MASTLHLFKYDQFWPQSSSINRVCLSIWQKFARLPALFEFKNLGSKLLNTGGVRSLSILNPLDLIHPYLFELLSILHSRGVFVNYRRWGCAASWLFLLHFYFCL